MNALRLELLSDANLAGVAEFVADEEVLRFTRVPTPVPPDFPQTWIGRYQDARRDGTREAFAVVDGEGAFLGLAMAPVIDREGRTAELGYIVAPAVRGRGVATEALRLLTEWAFAELGSLRLELHISVDNEPSRRVAANCGFVCEGVLRSVHVKQDVRADTEVWSRLPGDP